MIFIPKFETDWVGRQFKSDTGTVYTIVGYGDNDANGNPYLVGLSESNGRVTLKTLRFKEIELLPKQSAATVAV